VRVGGAQARTAEGSGKAGKVGRVRYDGWRYGLVWFACRWSQWWSSTRRASQTASISTSTSERRREDLRPSDVSRASTSCTSTALTRGNSQHRRARACCCDQGLSTPTVPYHSQRALSPLAGARPPRPKHPIPFLTWPHLTVAEATADAPAKANITHPAGTFRAPPSQANPIPLRPPPGHGA
jgi:hypothetical protein